MSRKISASELCEAHRLWRAQEATCIASMSDETVENEQPTFPPTLTGWLDYVQWCSDEFGVSIFGY